MLKWCCLYSVAVLPSSPELWVKLDADVQYMTRASDCVLQTQRTVLAEGKDMQPSLLTM